MSSSALLRIVPATVLFLGATAVLAEEPNVTPGTPDLKEHTGRTVPGPGDTPAKVPTTDTAPQELPLDQQILGWYGFRKKLEDVGLTFEFTVVADQSFNFKGGADTENEVFRHLFDARISLDTQKANWWNGGVFSVDFQNQNGRNGTDLYGDAQGFDNIDSHGITEISELWYEHTFGDDAFRIKLGKVDASTEFASVNSAGQFLNSSFGFSPTITGLPTYPDPAVSLNLFWTPVDVITLKYGIYDGGDGQSTGNHPPHTAWTGEADYFHIAEAGIDWNLSGDTLPGRLAVGVSYSNGRFERFRGGEQNGTESLYVILEQKIFNYATNTPTHERGVYVFGQFGTADEEVNDFRQHVSAGMTWVGPYMDTERLDSLGLGVTTVFFSDATGSPYTQDSETAIEAFYNFQATPWLSIKPDLQYVIHPGGDATLDDALIATLRVTLAL